MKVDVLLVLLVQRRCDDSGLDKVESRGDVLARLGLKSVVPRDPLKLSVFASAGRVALLVRTRPKLGRTRQLSLSVRRLQSDS
jgi:hypothetical protein